MSEFDDLEETEAEAEVQFSNAQNLSGGVTFVGAGPADLSLVSLAGVRAIKPADIVVVDTEDAIEHLAQSGINHKAEVVTVAADEAAQLIDAADAGKRVVRLTAGDFFNTDFREQVLPTVLSAHGMSTHIIPGVSRWVSALTYGAVAPTESFATLDASQGSSGQEWPGAETLIVWTRWEHAADVAGTGVERYGADGNVLALSDLGTTNQTSHLTTWGELASGEKLSEGECYLIVGPGVEAGERRRLDWFASKPLFDWRIVVPRTKDDLDELTDQLELFGANPEVVPTLAVEPPRTEQAMEKSLRGLIDGRYLWLVFTSRNAVNAIFERLEEYGLDTRALSGVNLAAVGRGTAERLARFGIRPDLVAHGENTVAGLAREFPAYDDLIDPLNRVLVPTADVNVAPLVEGLTPLGWEVEEVTAYRTVRAAPPPPETREAIKTGLFDAVVFTSSTAVRNMIGIAGKPHAAMAVAAIGPATAQACELHGLKVDVLADAPTFEAVADGLARFAVARRNEQIAKGLPVAKPSQRKRRRRRSSSAAT